MEVPPTDRLWLTEPRRTTALARVVAVRGTAFALDRSLFAPTSREHRHPQPHDTGTVWNKGEKRRLDHVGLRGLELWHRMRGAVPSVGATLQCQLDAERRDLASRAHTAMHLLLRALDLAASVPGGREAARGGLVQDPTVKGGGTFRLDVEGPLAAQVLAGALQQANAWVTQDIAVTREHMPRGFEAKMLDAQRFAPPDPFPGPATTLSVVRIGAVCAYPCDGTHVERTRKVGRIVLAAARPAHPGSGGAAALVTTLVGKVVG